MTLSDSVSAVDWGTVGVWFSAIGTITVSSLLLWFQRREGGRRRDRERREYAEQVSVWVHRREFIGPDPYLLVRVSNSARVAAYDVILRVTLGVRGTFVRWTPSLAPGETREWRIDLPNSPRTSVPGSAVMFTDARGVTWKRSASGALEESGQSEASAFRTPDPASYGTVDNHPTLVPPPDDREAQEGRSVEWQPVAQGEAPADPETVSES